MVLRDRQTDRDTVALGQENVLVIFLCLPLHREFCRLFNYTHQHMHIHIFFMRWAGHVERKGEERGVYRVLVGKQEGKRPLGRPRRRWVDNIRTDLQEMGCAFMDWIGLAQDRDSWRTLVSAVMNLRVP